MATKIKKVSAIGPDPTDAANNEIDMGQPYRVEVELTGVCDMLFHRWNCEAVAEKAAAAKGSKAKKSDNIESYVYRNDDDDICLPGEYVRQSIITAAKFKQDPRSPRKSAMDLFKAAIITLTPLASLGTKLWDYEHKCRVQVQRAGITRVRPAIKEGWVATLILMVNLPEYVSPALLHDVLVNAGRLVGVADFRPTYGRFNVTRFEILED